MAIHVRLDEQPLIAKHIDARWGPADARLQRVGVPVWSLVGYLRAFDGDSAQVRDAFTLTADELDAALAYYDRFRKVIDARLLLNDA